MTTKRQIKNIFEEAEISDLVIRYFRAVDDKQLDIEIVEATFTYDARKDWAKSSLSKQY